MAADELELILAAAESTTEAPVSPVRTCGTMCGSDPNCSANSCARFGPDSGADRTQSLLASYPGSRVLGVMREQRRRIPNNHRAPRLIEFPFGPATAQHADRTQ